MIKTTKDEALKLARTALQEVNYDQAYAAEISAIDDALAEQQQAGHTFYDGNGNVVAHLDATSEITMDYTKPSAWNYKETGRKGIYTPAKQQEPVECANGCRGFFKHHPPAQRKPWVGLTDAERLECMDGTTHYALCRAIEAKLKEKNGF